MSETSSQPNFVNVRQLIEQAAMDVDTFKCPSIDEAQKVLHEIIRAMDKGGVQGDTITSIVITEDEVYINSEWYARGCHSTSNYSFPASILDAEDPVKAATIYGLEEHLKEAKTKLARAKAEVVHAEKQVELYKTKLDDAQGAV